MRAAHFVITAALVGCASPARPITSHHESRARHTEARHQHVSGPARIELEQRAIARASTDDPRTTAARSTPTPQPIQALTEASLVARLSLDAHADVPVTVVIDVPPGASLRAGRETFTIPAMRPGLVIEEHYVVAFDANTAPSQPLTIHARAQSDAFGFDARAQWNFGRATPSPRRIVADGTPLVVGRRNFGPSVRAGQ